MSEIMDAAASSLSCIALDDTTQSSVVALSERLDALEKDVERLEALLLDMGNDGR